LIDFNQESLIIEAIKLNQILGPVFNFQDLQKIAYDDYEIIIKQAKEIEKDRNHGG
jgi:hypothetical protein